jgi:hypothetical protein
MAPIKFSALVAPALALLAGGSFGDNGATAASWLDSTKPVQWNRPGAAIPAAPRFTGNVDPRCRELTRPPQLDEDRVVHDRGWDLVDAFQGGWQVVVVSGAAGYDGMCRPLQYQGFVFVRGVFAGTLSPELMDSRTDGALVRVALQGMTRLTAEYNRYTPNDPLCCPSRQTMVVFAVAGEPAVVQPVSASGSGL